MSEMCKAGRHPWIPENIGSNGPGKQTCKPCRNESRSRAAKPCAVTGCRKDAHTRGWCGTHYDRWLKHGNPLWTPMTADEVIAEVEWLVEAGMSTFYIADALQRDQFVLSRYLYRHNRPDLGVLFGRVEDAA